MDKGLVLEKIQSLRRCLERVEGVCPKTISELKTNFNTQDVLVLNLERAVQLCVDIGLHILSDSPSPMPGKMADTFRGLRERDILSKKTAESLAKAVGFRNLAVHEYDKLNWDIVWSIITKHLSDFKDFMGCMLKYMDRK